MIALLLSEIQAWPAGSIAMPCGETIPPGVTVPEEAPELDRVVAMLGRSPRWPD